MTDTLTEDERCRIAEMVRTACLNVALDSYERAGLSGLCTEGRWEMAIDSIRSMDVKALARNYSEKNT